MVSGEILAMLFSELLHKRESLCYRDGDGNWYLNNTMVPTGKVSEACRLYETSELRGGPFEAHMTLFGDSRSDESFIVEIVEPSKYNLSDNGKGTGKVTVSGATNIFPKTPQPAYRIEKQVVFDPPKSLYSAELSGKETEETYAGVKGYKFVDFTFEGDALPDSEDVVLLEGVVGGVAFEGARRIFAEGDFAEIGNLTESVLVANMFGDYPEGVDDSNLAVFYSGRFTEVKREGSCFFVPYKVIRGREIADEWDLARLLFSLEYLAGYFPEQFMDKFWNRRRPKQRKRIIEVRVPIIQKPGDNGSNVIAPPKINEPDDYTEPDRKEKPAGATEDAKDDMGEDDDGPEELLGNGKEDPTKIMFEKKPIKGMARKERIEYFDSMVLYLETLPLDERESYVDNMLRENKRTYMGYLKALMRSGARLLGTRNEDILERAVISHNESNNGKPPTLPDYGNGANKMIRDLNFPVRGEEESWIKERKDVSRRKKRIRMSSVPQQPPPKLSEAPPKEGDGAVKV